MPEPSFSQVKLISNSPQALYMMDKEMAQHVFTPPKK